MHAARLLLLFVAACAAPDPGIEPDAAEHDARAADAAADADISDGCHADAECASGACNESTGTCIDEARVLFVAPTGADTAACTRAAPCATIGHAATLLATDRDTIALAAGSYAGIFSIAANALISGPSTDATAVMLTSPMHDAIIARFDTATITIEGVSIGGNTAMYAPQAVTIHNGANVTFDRVIVRDNDGTGVYTNGSKVTARRFEAFASDYGILANETSTIDVDRSYVHDNTSSGLAAAGDYRVVNTILAKNAIGFIPFGSNSGTLDFLTFVGQTSTVISSTHAISVGNSIFAQNPIGPSSPVAVHFSLFTGAPPAGAGNMTGEPAFVDAATGNYHIAATSGAIDRADPTATLATDIDGQPRPSGSGRDIGADER